MPRAPYSFLMNSISARNALSLVPAGEIPACPHDSDRGVELVGHSQISLTMNAYSHVVPGVLRKAVSKLAVALGQA